MSARKINRWPDAIACIFSGHTIQPENIALFPESCRKPAKTDVIARALDGFVLVKDGRFAYPRADYPDTWWRGVVAYGYTVALTGGFKYLVWAGRWDIDHEERHLEVVILANLVCISKESNRFWRNGNEDILWLETDQGFSYALLGPAEEYDRGSWSRVTASWVGTQDGATPSDPSFVMLKPQDSRPKWWDDEGDDEWQFYVDAITTDSRPPQQTALAVESNVLTGAAEPDYVDSGSSEDEPSPPPSRTRGLKRKQSPRRPEPRPLQRPRKIEYTYIDSDSDEEVTAPSSPIQDRSSTSSEVGGQGASPQATLRSDASAGDEEQGGQQSSPVRGTRSISTEVEDGGASPQATLRSDASAIDDEQSGQATAPSSGGQSDGDRLEARDASPVSTDGACLKVVEADTQLPTTHPALLSGSDESTQEAADQDDV